MAHKHTSLEVLKEVLEGALLSHGGKPVQEAITSFWVDHAEEFNGCPPGFIPDGQGGCKKDPLPPANV
jgi:hypothetical protein